MTQVSQRPDKDELEFKTGFSEAKRQCCHIISAMDEASNYVCVPKLSNLEEMWEKIRCIPPNERSILIFIKRIAEAKKHFGRKLVEHPQLQHSMSTKTIKKLLPTFMLGKTPNAPSIGRMILERQGLHSRLHLLETVEVVLKQNGMFLL